MPPGINVTAPVRHRHLLICNIIRPDRPVTRGRSQRRGRALLRGRRPQAGRHRRTSPPSDRLPAATGTTGASSTSLDLSGPAPTGRLVIRAVRAAAVGRREHLAGPDRTRSQRAPAAAGVAAALCPGPPGSTSLDLDGPGTSPSIPPPRTDASRSSSLDLGAAPPPPRSSPAGSTSLDLGAATPPPAGRRRLVRHPWTSVRRRRRPHLRGRARRRSICRPPRPCRRWVRRPSHRRPGNRRPSRRRPSCLGGGPRHPSPRRHPAGCPARRKPAGRQRSGRNPGQGTVCPPS